MKPIEALTVDEARTLRQLQAKHDNGGILTIGEQKEVAALVRKAAGALRKRIPRELSEHLKRIDKEAA